MYLDKEIFINQVTFFSGESVVYDPPRLLNDNNLPYTDVETLVNVFTWEILGRACHLLADVSTPAHALNDQHDFTSGEDFYEETMGVLYQNYNYQHAITQAQQWGIIDITSRSNPIKYLFFTSSQIAGHFPSRDVDGNNSTGINDAFDLYPPLENIMASLGPSPLRPDEHDLVSWLYLIPQIASTTFIYCIRATASLLHWFANECNLIPMPPTVVPIISGFTQSPNPLYGGNSGTVTCDLSQGNGDLNFEWSIVATTPGFTMSNSNSDYVIINYSPVESIEKTNMKNNLLPADLLIEGPVNDPVINCRVTNEAGEDISNAYINLAASPHGCPFVYTWNGETWVEDNNILPQSQDTVNIGQDVTDYYQLYTKPIPEDDKYYLAIGEFEEEVSHLDQLKLLVVDHPQDAYITVDENGQIIQFTKPAFFADALLDSTDVYRMLLEMDSVKTEVSEGDTLTLSFEDAGIGTDKYLLLLGQQDPIYKDQVAGNIINDGMESNTESTSFRLRKNPTYQWIMVPDGNSSSLQVDIAFETVAELDYAELSHELELPYLLYTPQLLSAEHSVVGDITDIVDGIDQNYAVLNTNEMIILEYSVPPITEGMDRTFIFVSSGRYISSGNSLENGNSNNIQNISFLGKTNIFPTEYKLYDNYPNPFNPATTIKFGLPQAGKVEITIYDQLGQKVETLINKEIDAGYHEIEWNAMQYSSGVYFYTINSGNFKAVKKMLLLK